MKKKLIIIIISIILIIGILVLILINNIYKDNYMKNRLQKYNFENHVNTYEDTSIINQLIKFTNLCIKSEMKNGLIISGNIGYEKTYLAACIANKMIENNKIDIGIIKNYCNLITTTDVLVLGCTHYPLVKEQIKKIKPNINFIDMGEILAENLQIEPSKYQLELYFSSLNETIKSLVANMFKDYKIEERRL